MFLLIAKTDNLKRNKNHFHWFVSCVTYFLQITPTEIRVRRFTWSKNQRLRTVDLIIRNLVPEIGGVDSDKVSADARA